MSEQTLVFLHSIVGFILSLLLSLLATKWYIRRSHNGQIERSFTLPNHRKKEGTPTSGGLIFVPTTILVYTLIHPSWVTQTMPRGVIIVFVAFFIIGLLDDLLKRYTHDYRGLSPLFRLCLEGIVGLVGLIIIGQYYGGVSGIDLVIINLFLKLGLFMIPLVIFIVVGSANSVNFSDGLDGLASGLILFALLPFVVIFLKNYNYAIAELLVCLIGSLIGFLVYNLHPAKIFMGDCGSLALGAILGLIAVLSKQYLVLVIAGALFIAETLSVIIQVAYYKFTKKRIFLMAPFHHHLEKKGWPEWRIVMVFWLAGFCLCLVATMVGVLS